MFTVHIPLIETASVSGSDTRAVPASHPWSGVLRTLVPQLFVGSNPEDGAVDEFGEDHQGPVEEMFDRYGVCARVHGDALGPAFRFVAGELR